MENTFASLPISEAIIKVTEELGFTQMTEIHKKQFLCMLAGKDLLPKLRPEPEKPVLLESR